MNPYNEDSEGATHCASCRLASSELGSVEACLECGMVRLNVRALSLRLEPDAFHALAMMVGEAHIKLRRHGGRQTALIDTLRHIDRQ